MQNILWWAFLTMIAWPSANQSAQTEVAHESSTDHAMPLDATNVGEPAGFAVAFKGNVTTARVNLVTVLPGDSVRFDLATPATTQDELALEAERGSVRQMTAGSWWWHAPTTPGLSRLVIRTGAGDAMAFNAFVLVESSQIDNGVLNGYRIGEYPTTPLRGLDIYLPPQGFIEVTPANEQTLVSPHFRLREFVTKQAGGYPKYVVLTERLVLKLEFLLAQLNAHGIAASSFVVMSGYRTPSYNHAIGNVRYSRHVYGAAADIFVDENPRDGQMDDLNGDRRIDVQDAQILVDIVNQQLEKPEYTSYIGGLGRYRANAHHGPFVHVDVRDSPARW